MRTAPVALAYLDDPARLVQAAIELSALTHADPEAGEACALWCLAIRYAVLYGTFAGIHDGLSYLASGPRAMSGLQRLREAEAREPSSFTHNGWVVEALQGAWSAICRTHAPAKTTGPRFGADQLGRALETAVRGGGDTDTVAAIAGAVIGARWGASAVPSKWRRRTHGWPGLQARDLVRLGLLSVRHGRDPQAWPNCPTMDYRSCRGSDTVTRHPHDDHVWLSGAGAPQ